MEQTISTVYDSMIKVT